jgi:formyl-CoA transferase
VPIADLLAGMNGAFGVLAALHERERTGRGRVVRTSLLASVIGIHGFQGTRATIAREVPRAIGNQHPSIAPYGLFRTADAPVQVAVGSEGLWASFAPLVGIAVDDPRFARNGDRVERREELRDLIEEAFGDTASEDVLADLDRAGVPCGKVRTLDDVYAWGQTRSQGLVIDVDHPVFGSLELPGPVLRFDDNAYAGGRRDHVAPPMLDEHRQQLLDWLDEQERSA